MTSPLQSVRRVGTKFTLNALFHSQWKNWHSPRGSSPLAAHANFGRRKKNAFLFFFLFKLPITQRQAAASKRISCWFQEHLNFVISVTWSAPKHLWRCGWRRVQQPDSDSLQRWMVNSRMQRRWMHILSRVTSCFYHHHHQGRHFKRDTANGGDHWLEPVPRPVLVSMNLDLLH